MHVSTASFKVAPVLTSPHPDEENGSWIAKAIGWAGALLVIGSLFLSRDFHGERGEGWALIGTGSLLAGGISLLVLGALETAGFTGLLAAREAGSGVVIGLASLAVGLLGIPLGAAEVVPLYASNAWFALAGVVFLGVDGTDVIAAVRDEPSLRESAAPGTPASR